MAKTAKENTNRKKPKKSTKPSYGVIGKFAGYVKNTSKLSKVIGVVLVLAFATFAVLNLTNTEAASENCQKEGTETICDIDQVAGNTDTVLSKSAEAKNLAKSGWGTYYGAAFRAPMHAYKGAVPITRIYNPGATYHDWTTPLQKSQKEAKYKGKTRNEGVAFYAWRTQLKGTVPVYRLTRGGPHTQTIYSTDGSWILRLLAQSGSDPNGWKRDQFAPYVAFYAYPPNYKVANAPNPYDCSIQANFVSERCKDQRENLKNALSEQEATKKKQETAQKQTEQIQKREQAAKAAQDQTAKNNPGQTQPAAQPAAQSSNPKFGNDPCPDKKGDEGLALYKNGVNNEGKKYAEGCHKLWIAYAQSKNTPAAAESPAKNNPPQQAGVQAPAKPAVTQKQPVDIGYCPKDIPILEFVQQKETWKKNMSPLCGLFYELEAKKYGDNLKRLLETVARQQAEERARQQAAAARDRGSMIVQARNQLPPAGKCTIKAKTRKTRGLQLLIPDSTNRNKIIKRSAIIFGGVTYETCLRLLYNARRYNNYPFVQGYWHPTGGTAYHKSGDWFWRP